MAISKRLRFEILRRDGHRCFYCHDAEKKLTVDHVVPIALGGTDDPTNLVAACGDCNGGKASGGPDAPLAAAAEDDAARWAAAMGIDTPVLLRGAARIASRESADVAKWLETEGSETWSWEAEDALRDWLRAYSKTGTPDESELAEAALNIRAALAVGYAGGALAQAAFSAGWDRSPAVANYLQTATRALGSIAVSVLAPTAGGE